jgi:DNA repair protein RadC
MQQKRVKLKNLPKDERPRERLLSLGSAALTNSELLALILNKGYKGQPVNILSQNILSSVGDIFALKRLSIGEILSLKGVGVAKACELMACVELARRLSGAPILRSEEYTSSKKVYDLIRPYLEDKQTEHFLIVTLDARYHLIAMDNISIGTVNQSLVHPREVFKAAINRRASFIILAHNHPSGDSNPSKEDLIVTEKLMSISKVIGIPIIDHVIVGDSNFMSLKDEEYLSTLS